MMGGLRTVLRALGNMGPSTKALLYGDEPALPLARKLKKRKRAPRAAKRAQAMPVWHPRTRNGFFRRSDDAKARRGRELAATRKPPLPDLIVNRLDEDAAYRERQDRPARQAGVR